MNKELFILSNNQMLLGGAQRLADHMMLGKNATVTVKRVTLMELMKIDANYKFHKRYSIAIVPDHIYEALHIFSGLENIKLIPSNISLLTFSTLLSELMVSASLTRLKKKKKSLFLTAKERRYCYLVFKGVSNKKIACNFQCTEKNISYLKRKIMMKWNCKNNVEFFKLINYFYCGDLDGNGSHDFF
uniref:helix-turn-helix transcriptional regulator n=1 Tax=Pantoea sp. IMH TaxID=1267600 RepID=UPI000468852F|nr:LuxR C-terminal-related transcriptional regulator [Pantoea sp. IMH]